MSLTRNDLRRAISASSELEALKQKVIDVTTNQTTIKNVLNIIHLTYLIRFFWEQRKSSNNVSRSGWSGRQRQV